MASVMTDAFTLNTPSNTASLRTSPSHQFKSTRSSLYASNDDEAGPDEATSGDAKKGGEDILNSPAFLSRKLDVLKSDIAAVEEKTDAMNTVYEENKKEWGPQIEDLRKEYSLMQERFKAENNDGTTPATIEVVNKMLGVLDNYDRAFQIITPETDEEKEIEAAYKEKYSIILSIFKELGVNEVDTVGEEFDYEKHQAVMTKPSDEYEEGTVSEELAKGYALENGKLIRAAMVVVAA